jgi:hypothetical protein
MPIRTKHEPTNLYCEHGHGAYERETHIFLREPDKEPIRICKSALELAAYLGGWVDSKKCRGYVSDVHDVEEYYKDEP